MPQEAGEHVQSAVPVGIPLYSLSPFLRVCVCFGAHEEALD